MKKVIYIIAALLVAGTIGFVLYQTLVASRRSPKDTVSFNANGLDIKVEYSRPYKRGRLIFGETEDQPLLPYGKYWRLGANAATEITFSKDVSFAGEAVAAGTYRMYAVPGAEAFQISLNSEQGVSGAHNEPDYTKDIAKVDIQVQNIPEIEQLTISFGNDSTAINMDIAWDEILVRVPIVPR